MGMVAGVTYCRRSQKWGCRGRLVLGFKNPGMSAKPGWGHAALARGCKHTALAEWGTHGGDIADGAGSLNHRLLLLS